MVTETFGHGQLLGCMDQFVAFGQHGGDGNVHVGRAAQGLDAGRRRSDVERVLIRP